MKRLPSLKIGLIFTLLFLTACVPPRPQTNQKAELSIHDIQGCTHISPYVNQQVEDINGIVTYKAYQGFYMQEEQPDARDCSSEGIYVHVGSYPDVYPGDRVSVTGRVLEYTAGREDEYNLPITEIDPDSIQIVSSGNDIPAAVVIGQRGRSLPNSVIDDDETTQFDPDIDGLDFFESLESMLIQVESGIVVGPRNSYNEVAVISPGTLDARQMSAAGALLATMEDQNPERILLNMNQSNTELVNLGARLVKPVMGIMDYSYGNFKINTIGRVYFQNTRTEIGPVEMSDGLLSIASFNVENLSRNDPESRFRSIARNIVQDLNSPDVLTLHEILDDSGVEDDGEVSAHKTLTKLVQAITSAGGPDYTIIDNEPQNNADGGIDGGNIRTVVLFREDRQISLVGNPVRIGENLSIFRATRKPLVCIFSRGEEQFLVIAVHLTSRGADSPLFGSKQPLVRPEEGKRNQQARYINDYVRDYSNNHPNTRVIVAGDMNDDPWSNTISLLEGNTLTDLARQLPETERYSYILDGNAIQLDYILVSDAAAGGKDTFAIVHLNSQLDYVKQTSDHDAVIAGINLGE